jgi:RNA polymerase sigma-70 factor (ECF subfamily)
VETSASLLDRLAADPSDADWRRLFDLYAPLLAAWLARAGVAPHDRDDLTQEVLLVVVREVGGFDRRRPGAFRTWLRTILANRVRDHFRDRGRRAVAAGGSAAHDRLEELADPDSPLSRVWDRDHDEHVAARAMARARADFAATTWEAFARQVLEGGSAGDVAAELGISRNAALVAKSRVLARVRAELAGLID